MQTEVNPDNLLRLAAYANNGSLVNQYAPFASNKGIIYAIEYAIDFRYIDVLRYLLPYAQRRGINLIGIADRALLDAIRYRYQAFINFLIENNLVSEDAIKLAVRKISKT